MPTKLLKWSWLAVAAALLLAATSQAQITQLRGTRWLNSTPSSHIGKYDRTCQERRRRLSPVLCGLPRSIWATGMAKSPSGSIPNRATSPWESSSAAPPLRGRCPRTKICLTRLRADLDRSNMPHWNTFTKQQRADLVAWVKHFSPRFQKEKPGDADSDSRRAGSHAGAREGWAGSLWPGAVLEVPWRRGHGQWSFGVHAYRRLEPAHPRPTTSPTARVPKCGSTDQDIYRIFMTGLDGTPMPSFSDNIKPDEAWDLVFYLRTLQPHNTFNSKERQIARQLGLKPVIPMRHQ